MIFSLVSSAQEWLNVKWDDHKREEDTRTQRKLKELEEAERVSTCSQYAAKLYIVAKCILNVSLKCSAY